MKKKILFCSLLLCSAAFVPQSIYAKEISSTAAKKLAKEKVKSATVTEVDVDYKNNSLVYEVNLYKGNREYELTYKASNGKLIKYEWEIMGKDWPGKGTKTLTEKKIKGLANKKIKNSSIKSVVLDYDDGTPEYKVILKKGKKLYTLLYHGKTGELLEYKWEIKKGSNNSSYIGTEKAKKIALEKVPGATVVKAEFDTDDGIPIYEIELFSGNTEYEITIHAETGEILEYDVD